MVLLFTDYNRGGYWTNFKGDIVDVESITPDDWYHLADVYEDWRYVSISCLGLMLFNLFQSTVRSVLQFKGNGNYKNPTLLKPVLIDKDAILPPSGQKDITRNAHIKRVISGSGLTLQSKPLRFFSVGSVVDSNLAVPLEYGNDKRYFRCSILLSLLPLDLAPLMALTNLVLSDNNTYYQHQVTTGSGLSGIQGLSFETSSMAGKIVW